MKAFAYLRVSSAGQVEGDGFARQRDTIGLVAKHLKFTVTKEFADEGISGETEWEKRPAFLNMVGAILDNGVRTIIVENLTRLARSFTIQEQIIVYLASKGINLISADTGENVTEAIKGDPMKRAMIQMQAVFSELEKNSLVRKLRAARERKKAETGRCEGRKPFGFLPGEPETITCMEMLRASRKSFAAIAKILDDEGLPSRSGKPWTPQSVKTILGRGEA